MGLLRKLAELVVEFPEEEQPAEPAAGATTEDVVAAIEKIRLDLEKSTTTDFEAGEAASSSPVDAADTAADAAQRTEALDAAEDAIRVPKALSVAEVYERAKLVHESGLDVYRVEEMLKDPEIADLDAAMKARMVRMTLKNMGHDLADILSDAGRRDQVLEDYLFYLERRVEEIEGQVGDANAGIQHEIDELIKSRQAALQQNEDKLRRVHDALEEYRRSKQAEEQRLFDIVAPFVEQGQNPVEIDG